MSNTPQFFTGMSRQHRHVLRELVFAKQRGTRKQRKDRTNRILQSAPVGGTRPFLRAGILHDQRGGIQNPDAGYVGDEYFMALSRRSRTVNILATSADVSVVRHLSEEEGYLE